MPELTCPTCGSENVIADTRIMDTGKHSHSELTAHVGDDDPEAVLLTEPITATLRADICCGCGTVRVRVNDPETLWSRFTRMPDQRRP